MPTENEVLEYAKQMRDRLGALYGNFDDWEFLSPKFQLAWIAVARHELTNRLVPLGTVNELQKVVEASYKTWLKSDNINDFYYVLAEAITARYGTPAPVMTSKAKAVLDAAVEWRINKFGSGQLLIRAVDVYCIPDPALAAATAVFQGAGYCINEAVLAEALKAAKEARQ